MAACLHNLAQLYLRQHRYAQAEPLYKRALAIWEKTLRPDHPQIGDTLEEYTQLLRETKRTSEAEAMMARATEILARNPQEQTSRHTVNVRDLEDKSKALRPNE